MHRRDAVPTAASGRFIKPVSLSLPLLSLSSSADKVDVCAVAPHLGGLFTVVAPPEDILAWLQVLGNEHLDTGNDTREGGNEAGRY